MDIQILNINDPSKESMKCIENFNIEWGKNFEWLDGVFEEMKSALSKQSPFLLPITPAQKKRKIKDSIQSTSINKENENNSINLSKNISEGSKENITENAFGVRKSKRIALRGVTNQSSLKNSEYFYSDSKQKRKVRDSQLKDNKDASIKRNNKQGINVDEFSVSEAKFEKTNEVYQTTRSKNSFINEKTNDLKIQSSVSQNDGSENKENQLLKTPYNNINLSNSTATPSVKHRIQTYEQHIKTMNTPKLPTKVSRMSGPLRRSSRCKSFNQSKNILKTKQLILRSRKSRNSSLSKNDDFKKTPLSIRECYNGEENHKTPTLILKRLEDLSAEEQRISGIHSSDLNNNVCEEKYKSIIQAASIQSTPKILTVKVTPLQKNQKLRTQLEKTKLSTGTSFGPKLSSSVSTGKLLNNRVNRISKLSSGYLKQTPQASLSCVSQKSLISRVMSLKQQMTPSVKGRISQEIKKKQQREEEVLMKKSNLLKMKIEEQKRKREERMRKAIETRQKLEQEKDQKRNLEITKEERSAKKEAELKQKQKETIQKKQLMRQQKQAEVEQRRRKEEECRLQKIKEVTSSTLVQKAIHNNYQSKQVGGEKSKDKERSKEDTPCVLNETYNKPENDTNSYEMTPVRRKEVISSSDPENYDINDLKSDDDTDDETAPRKKIPSWAQGIQLRACLLQQHCNPPDLDALFGEIDIPDLAKIFALNRKRFLKRTSSAVWLSRSFASP